MPVLNVTDDQVEEMRTLVSTGDIKLEDERKKFFNAKGRDTTLSDDDLLAALAATEDDDEELLIQNMLKAEAEVNNDPSAA